MPGMLSSKIIPGMKSAAAPPMRQSIRFCFFVMTASPSSKLCFEHSVRLDGLHDLLDLVEYRVEPCVLGVERHAFA